MFERQWPIYGIEEKPYELTLLILDECHHTRGKDPYLELVKTIFPSVGSLRPFLKQQILGITASFSYETNPEVSFLTFC